MLFNKIIISFFTILIAFQLGCNLQPIYEKKELKSFYCSIEVSEPRSTLIFYELEFYNSLKLKFCNNALAEKSLFLEWDISKTNSGLLTAKDAAISRYEITLTATFALKNKKTSETLLSSKIYSKAAHNVLEDELFSTLTAERNATVLASKDLVEQIFYTIYLFEINNQ